MQIRIQNFIFWLLGLLMIVFGLNKFFGFIAVVPPEDATAQQFLMSMFGSYLFGVVAVAEVLRGILLFLNRTRYLGWLLLSPIVFNIVAFHLAHDFVGNGIWLLPTALFVLGGYFLKDNTIQLLKQVS